MKREVEIKDAATVFVSPAPSNHQIIEQVEAWLIENCEEEIQLIYMRYTDYVEKCDDLEAFLAESRVELNGPSLVAMDYQAKFQEAMAVLRQKFSYLCSAKIGEDDCMTVVRSARPLAPDQYFDIGPSTYFVHRAEGTPFMPPIDAMLR